MSIEQLRQRVEAAGYPGIFLSSLSRAVVGRHGWQSLLENPTPYQVQEIDRALEREERDMRQREEFERKEALRDAPPDEAARAIVEAPVRDAVESAARDHAYRNSPAGQSERVIALLERIAAAVEVRK